MTNLFKKTCFILAPLCLLLLGTAATLLVPADWQLVKNKNNIKVYTRTVAGNSLKDFKGITEIGVSPDKVAAQIEDVASYKKWMHAVIESKKVSTISGTEFIEYLVIDAPWPATDRDAYIRSTSTKNADGSIQFSFSAVPDFGKKTDKVRIPELTGYWKIVPTSSGSSVEYMAHSDPGGSLPDWIVNSFVVDNPFNSLQNLQNRLK